MPRERKQFGGRPKGWAQVTFDAPSGLAMQFKNHRLVMPTDSLKLLGTAAIGAFLALPLGVQLELYAWAHRAELDPEKIDPKEAGAILLAVLATLEPVVPTESGPGEKAVSMDGLVTLIHPPEQREGYTVQTHVTYQRTKPSDQRPEDKRADDKGRGAKGAAG